MIRLTGKRDIIDRKTVIPALYEAAATGRPAVLDLLKPSALGALAMRSFGRTAADFTLLEARLGNEAGMVGAATLAAESLAGSPR